MIRFVHKVHFDEDFLITQRLTLFSRDNLKNFDTIMCLFDRLVNHVNCWYFYVVFFFFFFFFFFFLLFIMCRLAKKDQKETKTNTHKQSKFFRKNPEAVKWISGSVCRCACYRHTLVFGIGNHGPRPSGPAK